MAYYNSKGEEVRFAYGVDALESLAAGLVFEKDPTAVSVKKAAPKAEAKVELPAVEAPEEEADEDGAPKRKAPRRRASAE